MVNDKAMEYNAKVIKIERTIEILESIGLDTKDYSMMYLYSWSKDRDFKEIDNSFNTIVNYSKKIIDNYQKMADKELEYNISQESVSI